MIVGQKEIVEGVLVAFFAGGHVLLEGVPGLGKTMLVRTLADAVNLKFARVQFTPDLMPADIVGTNIISETEHGHKEFTFQPGPVFANILLADEINRATPKTQSACSRPCRSSTSPWAASSTRSIRPSSCSPRQNPLEMEGTYPLPEAQLDRFFFKLKVLFPSADDLHTILDRTTAKDSPVVSKVLHSPDEVVALRDVVRQVPLAHEIQAHAVDLVLATHPDNARATPLAKKYVRYGASPRGAQALILAAKIHAVLDGRYHVSRADIDQAAPAALRHRIILNFEGRSRRHQHGRSDRRDLEAERGVTASFSSSGRTRRSILSGLRDGKLKPANHTDHTNEIRPIRVICVIRCQNPGRTTYSRSLRRTKGTWSRITLIFPGQAQANEDAGRVAATRDNRRPFDGIAPQSHGRLASLGSSTP